MALGLGAIAVATPALAKQETYTYTVTHPSYGRIGTLTQTIDNSPEGRRIDSHLRIAVEQLGIVVYRQNCDATEIMNGDRLISLQSVTELNGRHLEVLGKAQGEQFVVNTAEGSFAGPATTAPSEPWAVKRTGEQYIVHPSTGKLGNVQISGGDYETISVDGASVSVRHFAIDGENHEDVWLDDRGIPIMFRTVEDGTPIDFVLQNTNGAADSITVASIKHPSLPRVLKNAK
jgi:hypothetical protein